MRCSDEGDIVRDGLESVDPDAVLALLVGRVWWSNRGRVEEEDAECGLSS